MERPKTSTVTIFLSWNHENGNETRNIVHWCIFVKFYYQKKTDIFNLSPRGDVYLCCLLWGQFHEDSLR